MGEQHQKGMRIKSAAEEAIDEKVDNAIGNIPAWEQYAIVLFLMLTLQGTATRLWFAFVTHQDGMLDSREWLVAVGGGLRFDLAIAGAITGIHVLLVYVAWRLRLLRDRACGWYATAFSALYLMQVGDMLYARESGRHISYEIVELFDSADSLAVMFSGYLSFFLPLLPLLAFSARWRLPVNKLESRKWQLTEVRLLLLLVGLSVALRGGLSDLPMQPSDAHRLGPSEVSLTALNGGYAVLYSVARSHRMVGVPPLPEMSKQQEQALLHAMYADTDSISKTPSGPLNFIIVFLESWPAERSKSYGFDKDATPEFDRIRARSLTTRAMLAGGHRTVEGVFSTLCSLQNPERVSIATSQLLNHRYICLPHILREAGYQTAFFQGMHRNSAKLGNLVHYLGFTEVQGKEEVTGPLRYSPNSWGVHDADLYRHVLMYRKTTPEPQLIAINTTTTHDEKLPTGIPAKFGQSDPESRQLSVLHFADAQLGEFVRMLEQQPLHLPTVLILVADHTAYVNSSPFNHYRVPFAVYAPGIVTAGVIDIAASQRDIAPTIADLAGVPAPHFTGRTLLADGPHFADYQHAGRLGWVEGDRLIEFFSEDGRDLHCYDWRSDNLMRHPLPCTQSEEAAKARAIAFTRRSVQLLFSGQTSQFHTFLRDH